MVFTGIDVGGSSIKSAPVDVSNGALAAPVAATSTPAPATPAAVASAIASLIAPAPAQGPVGIAVPSVVKQGVTWTAANIDATWVGANVEASIRETLGRPVTLLNDADAAGIAEMRFGAGRDERGTVILLTFGTGIGTALFTDGRLFANTELGHLERAGREVEQFASGRSRSQERLDWPQWIERVNAVLAEYHRLFWPDLFILGGGVTERYEEFAHLLRSRTRIVPAQFRAQAGIVGAAIAAADSAERG
jgi:polyphosphate glucokinase